MELTVLRGENDYILMPYIALLIYLLLRDEK